VFQLYAAYNEDIIYILRVMLLEKANTELRNSNVRSIKYPQ